MRLTEAKAKPRPRSRLDLTEAKAEPRPRLGQDMTEAEAEPGRGQDHARPRPLASASHGPYSVDRELIVPSTRLVDSSRLLWPPAIYRGLPLVGCLDSIMGRVEAQPRRGP